MNLVLLAGVVLGLLFIVGLVCFAGTRTHQGTSTRGLGKDAGHTGSARYKNRSSRRRDKKSKAP